jgi:hypothetical protein
MSGVAVDLRISAQLKEADAVVRTGDTDGLDHIEPRMSPGYASTQKTRRTRTRPTRDDTHVTETESQQVDALAQRAKPTRGVSQRAHGTVPRRGGATLRIRPPPPFAEGPPCNAGAPAHLDDGQTLGEKL